MSSDEKVVTVSLRRIYDGRKAQRSARAIRKLRELIKRRTHAEIVKIDESVNSLLWNRGIEKPPRKLKVKLTVEEKEEVKTKDGRTLYIPKIVRVSLHSDEIEESEKRSQKGAEGQKG